MEVEERASLGRYAPAIARWNIDGHWSNATNVGAREKSVDFDEKIAVDVADARLRVAIRVAKNGRAATEKAVCFAIRVVVERARAVVHHGANRWVVAHLVVVKRVEEDAETLPVVGTAKHRAIVVVGFGLDEPQRQALGADAAAAADTKLDLDFPVLARHRLQHVHTHTPHTHIRRQCKRKTSADDSTQHVRWLARCAQSSDSQLHTLAREHALVVVSRRVATRIAACLRGVRPRTKQHKKKQNEKKHSRAARGASVRSTNLLIPQKADTIGLGRRQANRLLRNNGAAAVIPERQIGAAHCAPARAEKNNNVSTWAPEQAPPLACARTHVHTRTHAGTTTHNTNNAQQVRDKYCWRARQQTNDSRTEEEWRLERVRILEPLDTSGHRQTHKCAQ